MKVALLAPPWLAVPVKGYGGIELVIEGLVKEFQTMGVDVEIFGNGARKIPGVKTHFLYDEEQFSNIHLPFYESSPILLAHMQFALNAIKKDGTFDVIHDHNGYMGPALLAAASYDPELPPIVHTHHGPPFSNEQTLRDGIPDNRPFWNELGKVAHRLYVVGISNTLMRTAPKSLAGNMLPAVYNAIQVENFPYQSNKKNYYITLARFTHDKGQHVAAKICGRKGYRLRMAGTVAGIETSRKLLFELANPLSAYRGSEEFRYYSDKVLPYTLRYRKISYSGNLSGARKMKFISEARALLFPIDWEEPFGMAVIEALACGTPVVAMRRGAMPEIIEHGVNGFLADTEKQFEEYVDRVGEIDPAACRESVIRKFSAETMATEYLGRYRQAISLSKRVLRHRHPTNTLVDDAAMPSVI